MQAPTPVPPNRQRKRWLLRQRQPGKRRIVDAHHYAMPTGKKYPYASVRQNYPAR